MSESEPSKRRLGTAGEFVIAGVIGAVIGWPITKGLDTWSNENKWPWWVYLVGVAIAFVLALFVMTFIIERWRRAFWGGIRRGLVWLWSWHPVSARMHSAARVRDMTRASRVIRDYDKRLRDILPDTIRKVIRDDKESQERMQEVMQPLVDLMVQRQLKAHAALTGAANAGASSVAPALAVPLPEPRWTIEHNMFDKTEYDFTLINRVPRSVAREVRIEGATDVTGYSSITILDAGHFENLSGKSSGEFRARFDQEARYDGATFSINWYDENAKKQWDEIYVHGWEARPQPDFNAPTPF